VFVSNSGYIVRFLKLNPKKNSGYSKTYENFPPKLLRNLVIFIQKIGKISKLEQNFQNSAKFSRKPNEIRLKTQRTG